MSKIIIYDNKNILVADLDRTEVKQDVNGTIRKKEHVAIFKDYRIIKSISLKKQLKKIEKIFKYHKEKKNTR